MDSEWELIRHLGARGIGQPPKSRKLWSAPGDRISSSGIWELSALQPARTKGWIPRAQMSYKPFATLITYHNRRVVCLPKVQVTSQQRPKYGEQVKSLETRLRKKCEPASDLINTHGGLHATRASGSRRSRRETGGEPSGIQRQKERRKIAVRLVDSLTGRNSARARVII
jgi:hypothetical protein